MKKSIRLGFLLLLTLVLTSGLNLSFGEMDIKVFINNEYKEIPQNMGSPFFDKDSNRVLLPVRYISESLGAKVEYIKADKAFTVEKGDKLIKVFLGRLSGEVTENGKKKTIKLDTPPRLIKDRAYLPVRFTAEMLGEKVDWNGDNNYVLINSQMDKLKIKKDNNIAYKETSVETITLSTSGGNKTLNVVKIDMDNPARTIEHTTANNRVVGSEPFSNFIKKYQPLAAINGNFFDAYDSLEPMGTIIRNGQIIHKSDIVAGFVQYEDGELDIIEKSPHINGYLDGKRKNEWNVEKDKMEFNIFEIWYVNHKPTDSSGVYLYTRDRGETISLPKGNFIRVRNGQVESVSNLAGPSQVSIGEGEYIIYYGSGIEKSYVDQRFWKGRKVELENTLEIDGRKEERAIKNFVGAGPVIVYDGNLASNQRLNKVREAKISKNRAQRSALGISKDNILILATGSNMNVKELGEAMLKLGAYKAMNLDGGASSALYANGRYLQQAGRNLNNVLIIK